MRVTDTLYRFLWRVPFWVWGSLSSDSPFPSPRLPPFLSLFDSALSFLLPVPLCLPLLSLAIPWSPIPHLLPLLCLKDSWLMCTSFFAAWRKHGPLISDIYGNSAPDRLMSKLLAITRSSMCPMENLRLWRFMGLLGCTLRESWHRLVVFLGN